MCNKHMPISCHQIAACVQSLDYLLVFAMPRIGRVLGANVPMQSAAPLANC
jgi:hypothetical protein